MANLTRSEAEARSALIDVTAYRVELDLDQGATSFESSSTVRFTCAQPGASTFLDVKPHRLHRATLNGVEIDGAGFDGQRIALTGLSAENEVVVTATMSYSKDGQGLHRAIDPADDQHYAYGHSFLDAAPRVFACFDQPDLKAPYDVTVTAPPEWIVLGNGAATRTGEGSWVLATTKPLATYFFTVCAGPYVSVAAEHDGIPLGIHARASLREPLERQAEQILTITRQSFDYYHSLFGMRYPFGEYHQVFVPEFNAGAMENPGCVTLRDQYVFRGATTHDEVLTRSNTITHEMAHMWFGDLVTMQWWDDLWLNESFAEYMSHRTLFAATEFTDAWVDSSMARKPWGYGAERMPSTHPVAGSTAPDAQSALQNFDGISYAKGSATLVQLIEHIGDAVFIAGVADYLRSHAYGNASLADFMGAMERSSGKDLQSWADAWLRTAGLDAISLETTSDQGLITSATVRRTPPDLYPADRPHSFDIAGFSYGTEVFRVATTVDRNESILPELEGKPIASLVIPNAADLTWANIKLDAATVAAAPTELSSVPLAQARAVVWTALMDGVALAEIDPRHLLAVMATSWAKESNQSIINRVGLQMTLRIIPQFIPLSEQAGAYAVMAKAAASMLDQSEPGSSRALVAARYVATSSADEDLLRGWAFGDQLPEGLAGDSDFRWVVLGNLARRGAIGPIEIDAALERDHTMQGNLKALQAKASAPDALAKEWAWEQITGDHGRSNYELNALSNGFWHAADHDVLLSYVPRYFTDVPALSGRLGEDALARVAALAFPSNMVEQSTADQSASALARADLTASVRRAIIDADSELREALASRAVFG
ncbi:MAG: aminopeptidase N [Phycicoccus sp.]|nr:aminopeptidase N [Phycicoccus sp.]NMM32972.1 aminopeptidase N [Phycicoccus sp.]